MQHPNPLRYAHQPVALSLNQPDSRVPFPGPASFPGRSLFCRILVSALLVLLPVFSAQADVVDSQPTLDPSVRGVYIWRTSGGDWQLRVVGGSGGGSGSFVGIFHSSGEVTEIAAVALEADDQWSVSDSRTIKVAFDATLGSMDGLRFANARSGLCLSSQGGLPVTVRLGKSAVPVTTPVDLTGDATCAKVLPPATVRKYHSGHYIFMMRKLSSQTLMSQSDYTGVRGIVKRYTWKQLEPTAGNYDFSTVAADLDLVASMGLQFIIMIEDRTFVDENPLPDYLAHLAHRNVSSFGKNGYTAIRWDPYLVSRLNAMTEALGRQFDANPAFEGLIPMEETALGFPGPTLDELGYTPEKYRDALISMLRSAGRSAPHSRVFWFMNFLPRKQDYIREVAAAVKDWGVVMGGPDVMPDNEPLLRLTYPFYEEFAGQMLLFNQVEPICYAHEHLDTSYPTRYWTMPELFAYGRDHLHANYFFWVRLPTSAYPDSYNYTHALPVIEQNPVFNP